MIEIKVWPFGSSSIDWRRVKFYPKYDITPYELAVCVKLLTLNSEEIYIPRRDSAYLKDHFGDAWDNIGLIDRHFVDYKDGSSDA